MCMFSLLYEAVLIFLITNLFASEYQLNLCARCVYNNLLNCHPSIDSSYRLLF